MRKYILLLVMNLPFASFAQIKTDSLLLRAYKTQSDSLLTSFLNNWAKEVSPKDDSDLNDSLKIANKLVEQVYLKAKNKYEEEKKYIIVDNRANIEIVFLKEDAELSRLIKKIKKGNKNSYGGVPEKLREQFTVSKAFNYNNYQLTFQNAKVLYLNEKNENILQGDLKKRSVFDLLKKEIFNLMYSKKLLQRMEIKEIIFLSKNLAIVSEKDCDGVTTEKNIYLFKNNKWNYLYHASMMFSIYCGLSMSEFDE